MLFFAALLALPVILAHNIHKRTVTPDILTKLKYFSEYSAEGYCAENYGNATHGFLSCPGSICPQLQNDSVQVVMSFFKVGSHQTTGLVISDHTYEQIVITFRGTISNADWDTDLDFVQDDASDICKGCEVHGGFLGSWRGVRSIVLETWSGLQKQYAGYNTIVTGHSLGGAIANLCAAELTKNSTSKGSISLYTYGSPRVGNPTFANFITSTLESNNYRVTHLNDPVPRLPGRFFEFAHPGPEYHIKSPYIPHVLSADYAVLTDPQNLVVATTDVLVLQGAESQMGNSGYTCTDIDMHDAYFVSIAGCVPDDGGPSLRDFGQDICYVLDVCCNRWFD